MAEPKGVKTKGWKRLFINYALRPQISLLQEVIETKYEKDLKDQIYITDKTYPVILIDCKRKMLAGR